MSPDIIKPTEGTRAMPTTNQSELIRTAKRCQGVAVASSWRAEYVPATDEHPEHVEVWHYSTPMLAVAVDGSDMVLPISKGRESMTDKCGVRKILQGYGFPLGYWDVYGGGCKAPNTLGGFSAPTYARTWAEAVSAWPSAVAS
jgi:hypothetical protein